MSGMLDGKKQLFDLDEYPLIILCIFHFDSPYIPHASFNDHKDITTGIAWRGCPDLLLSTSKVS